MTTPTTPQPEQVDGYKNLLEYTEVHANQIRATLEKSINQNSLAWCSRIFNDTAYRGALSLSLDFSVCAAGTPVLDGEAPSHTLPTLARTTLAQLPQLAQWYQAAKAHAILDLFDQAGRLHAALRALLEPTISQAYQQFGEEAVNQQLLVSYMLSFVLGQAVEADRSVFLASPENDFATPAPLAAQSLLTHVLNAEATTSGALIAECAQVHRQHTQQQQRDLQRYFEWAQYCAAHAHHNPQRFLVASRILNMALIQQLPANFGTEEMLARYEYHFKNATKIQLSAAASRKISQLSLGLVDFRPQHTDESHRDQARMTAAQTVMSIEAFMHVGSHNYAADMTAKPDNATATKFCNAHSHTPSLYQDWRRQSYLGFWHFRFLSQHIRGIDKSLQQLERGLNAKIATSKSLAHAKRTQTKLNLWVSKKQHKYATGIHGQSRLPAGLVLQRKIDALAAELEKSVYQSALSHYNQQERQAKNKHQGIKANNERFAAGLFRQPQAVTTHKRRRSTSLFQRQEASLDTDTRQRNGSYCGG